MEKERKLWKNEGERKKAIEDRECVMINKDIAEAKLKTLVFLVK